MEELALLTHIAATWFMVGLIWFVQLVHYPLMAKVGKFGYVEYQREHQRRTAWVVAPTMLLELGSAGWLCWRGLPTGETAAWPWWAAMALLAVNWVSTAAWQMPLHHRLSQEHDAALLRQLVASNWLRTVAWSLRALLVTSLLVQP